MEMEDKEQLWIESPNGWGAQDEQEKDNDNDGGLIDLFETDPNEDFAFHIRINTNTTKTICLRGFKLDSEETDRSTGVTLWKASPRLAKYLQENSVVCKGKSVLELGAGLGLCGITAHYLGAKSMLMTDADTQTLQKMRENVRQNCPLGDVITTTNNPAIDCRQLMWGSPHMEKFSEHEKYDTILGADVIYTHGSIQPLFDTVAFLLMKPHGIFILSRYTKWNGVDDAVVIEAAKSRCLDCDRTSEGIFLFRWNENESKRSG